MRRLGRSPHHISATVVLVVLAISFGCANPSRRKRQRAFEARQARIEADANKDDVPAWRKRDRPRMSTPTIKSFMKLGESVGAQPISIDAPCLDRGCKRRALGRFFEKLDRIEEDQQGVARILILGDSHIAADYIARTIRERLQRRFGNAGRGFVAIDQKAQYGGRRLSKNHWARTRIVDGDGPGQAFGFSGMRLDALRPGAELEFELEDDDDDVVAYFISQPQGAPLSFFVADESIGRLPTQSDRPLSRIHRIAMPGRVGTDKSLPKRLRIVSEGPRAALFGLSFESYESGIIIDAIGPVGADASVYLQMDGDSFRRHLRALDPDLVMLMIGGNDALAVRKGDRTMKQVGQDHLSLLRRIKKSLPDADCLIWSPLDAGVRKDGRIESKANLADIRDLQKKVAKRARCAFWDTYEAMGGRGSFSRWFEKDLMNRDLIHPRSKGGDLLGHLFATSFMNAYLNGS